MGIKFLSPLIDSISFKNVLFKKSLVVLVVLTSFVTFGGAAYYFKRKRIKKNQSAIKDETCEEIDEKTANLRNRRISSSSNTLVSSICSSPRNQQISSNTQSIDDDELDDVDAFEEALEKLDLKLSSKHETSNLTLVVDKSSNETVKFEDFQENLTPVAGQSLTSVSPRQARSRASVNKLEKQLHSIVERAQNLPSVIPFEEASRRRLSDCSVTSDFGSTSSYFSAKDVWEIRSTDFAMTSSVKLRFDLYEEGVAAAASGRVTCRSIRTNRVQCSSDDEFLAKLFCLRIGFEELLKDENVKKWFEESGRLVMETMLCAANRNCDAFTESYNKLVAFCRNEEKQKEIEKELKTRKVMSFTFYDVVLDYLLMDAFDTLEEPPSVVTAIMQNRWLGDTLKESALTSAVWSVLKAKRQTLSYTNGFLAHLYDVSALITPDIAWGFLGPESSIKTACQRFKDETMELLASMFSLRRVRFTTKEELAEDLVKVMQERFQSFLTFMHEKVLKDQRLYSN